MATYKMKGTCSREVHFEVENGVVTDCTFVGGCPGNTQAVSKLVRGRTVDELIDMLGGIKCGFKKTSCPDQLSKALQAYKEGKIK